MKCKILIADDHQDTAEMLAVVMAFLGYDVRCAFDGGQALGLAGEFEPDVVMLDINMPVADGYEVARSLRAARRGWPFLIAMTGASSVETAQKAKDAGFDVHMAKPVAMEDIEGILGRAGFH